MNELMDWLNHGLEGLLNLVKNPFMWLGLFVSGFIIHLHIQLTRKLFYRKFQILLKEVTALSGAAVITGIIISIPLYWLTPDLAPVHLSVVWGISIFLFFFRVRWMHAFYPVSLLSLIYGALSLAGWPGSNGAALLFEFIRELPMAELWYMLAVIWAGEAFLLRLIGTRLSVPLNVQRLRSRVIGGYWSEFSIPVPVWLFTAASSFVPIPMFVSRAQRVWSQVPDQAMRNATPGLIGLSLMAGGNGVLLQFLGQSDAHSLSFSLSALVIPILMIVFVEWGQTVRESREINREPLFIHGRRGFRVLGVVPGSQAEQMEIHAGDIIHKVNGFAIRTRSQWHEAMAVNPAFCKLEVENRDGHIQLMQRALYADRDHQLGLVFCPDGESKQFVRLAEANWWRVIRRKLTMLKPVVSPSMVVSADTLDQWPGHDVLGLPPVQAVAHKKEPHTSVDEEPAKVAVATTEAATDEPDIPSPVENEISTPVEPEWKAVLAEVLSQQKPHRELDEEPASVPMEEPVQETIQELIEMKTDQPIDQPIEESTIQAVSEPVQVLIHDRDDAEEMISSATDLPERLETAIHFEDVTKIASNTLNELPEEGSDPQPRKRKKKQPIIEELIEQLETHADAFASEKNIPAVQENQANVAEIVDMSASVLQTDSEKPKRNRRKKTEVALDDLIEEVVPLLDPPKRERKPNTASLQQEELTNG